MTIAIGQTDKVSSPAYGTASTGTTPGVTTATGSTFVILVNAQSQAITSVSDSKSNTYTLKSTGAGYNTASVYVCDNGAGGSSHTATVNLAGADSFTAFLVEVTSASNPSFDVEGNGSDTGGGTTFTGASVTTTNADDLILSFIGLYGGATTLTNSGSGFSIAISNVVDGTLAAAVSYSVKSATGTYNDAYTASDFTFAAWATVALKAGAAAPPGVDTGIRSRKVLRPGIFKPMGDALRPAKYRGWR